MTAAVKIHDPAREGRCYGSMGAGRGKSHERYDR